MILSFASRRLIQLLPVLWGVATIVFLFLHFIPGDPIDILLGEHALPASREALRAKLHLDDPLLSQYGQFWKNIFHGNLGESLFTKRNVSQMIAERLWPTASLALCAVVFSLLIAIPLGVLAAAKKKSLLDRLILLFTTLGVSMPSFWFGPLLMLFFSVRMGWLPVSERSGIESYILPALTLGLSMAAILTKMTRNSMSEALAQDYIVTARSKGLSMRKIYFTHALKNSLIPVISLLGLQLGSLLSGAIIVETIFDWPGLGELLYRGIQSRDYPVVQACVLIISCIYVFTNALADIAYTIVNPKLRAS